MNATIEKTDGLTLRELRLLRGLSIQEVARKCDIGEQTIRSWEYAKSRPRPPQTRYLSEILKITMQELTEVLDETRRRPATPNTEK